MANFITTSVNWSGKETLDYLITPMFLGGDPLNTYGIAIKTGVKDKERVRKLLQGTANLEFWETYDNKEIAAKFSTEIVIPGLSQESFGFHSFIHHPEFSNVL
jgi:hypothetical protein